MDTIGRPLFVSLPPENHEMGTVLFSEALGKAPDVIFCALFENKGPRARFLDSNPVFKDFHAGRPARPAQPGLIW